MTLIEFPEQNVVFAKDQPEYSPLPAYVGANGKVTCCWELSDEELKTLCETKKIWHQILTFENPLQPQLLLVEKPSLL